MEGAVLLILISEPPSPLPQPCKRCDKACQAACQLLPFDITSPRSLSWAAGPSGGHPSQFRDLTVVFLCPMVWPVSRRAGRDRASGKEPGRSGKGGWLWSVKCQASEGLPVLVRCRSFKAQPAAQDHIDCCVCLKNAF